MQRRQAPEALPRPQERGRGGCHVHQRPQQALQQEGASAARRARLRRPAAVTILRPLHFRFSEPATTLQGFLTHRRRIRSSAAPLCNRPSSAVVLYQPCTLHRGSLVPCRVVGKGVHLATMYVQKWSERARTGLDAARVRPMPRLAADVSHGAETERTDSDNADSRRGSPLCSARRAGIAGCRSSCRATTARSAPRR